MPNKTPLIIDVESGEEQIVTHDPQNAHHIAFYEMKAKTADGDILIIRFSRSGANAMIDQLSTFRAFANNYPPPG